MAMRPRKILLVEDDDLDATMFMRFLKTQDAVVSVERVKNGEEALAAVASDQPDMVMLDIRMPVMDGRETVKRMKQNPETANVPVVMMSTSSDPDDVDFCYRHHANAYLIKPTTLAEADTLVRRFLEFWFQLAVLPVRGQRIGSARS